MVIIVATAVLISPIVSLFYNALLILKLINNFEIKCLHLLYTDIMENFKRFGSSLGVTKTYASAMVLAGIMAMKNRTIDGYIDSSMIIGIFTTLITTSIVISFVNYYYDCDNREGRWLQLISPPTWARILKGLVVPTILFTIVITLLLSTAAIRIPGVSMAQQNSTLSIVFSVFIIYYIQFAWQHAKVCMKR